MSVAVAVTHPLDPLTGEEIVTAVGVVRGTGDLERPVFSLVVLVDPPKDVVVGFEPGDAIGRRVARSVATTRARRTHEGIVDLGTGDLESWRVLDGVLPPIVDEDFERAAEAALADPRFVEALRRRGIEDLSIVQVDPLVRPARRPVGHDDAGAAGDRVAGLEADDDVLGRIDEHDEREHRTLEVPGPAHDTDGRDDLPPGQRVQRMGDCDGDAHSSASSPSVPSAA